MAKEELARECDYELEAANQKRFRELLGHEQGVYVPLVFDEFCSKRVLTTEFVAGNTTLYMPFLQPTVLFSSLFNKSG